MENSKKNYMIKIPVMKVITIMLRILWISFAVLLLYPQCVCKSSEVVVVKKIDISEKLINKDLDYLKEDVKIPIFINGRAEERVKDINNIVHKDIMSKLAEAEKAAEEQFSGKNQKPLFPYEIKSYFTITKKNDDIISLYNDYYEFLGGAHGSTIRTGYTVDRNTEQLLSLKDLFTEKYDYKNIINNKIKEELRKNPEKYFYSADNFQGISDNQGFYISDGSLIIFYEQYDIAPYVAGIPEFKISVEEFDKKFKYQA
ncbi:MAG: DUF3298 and DUF4163 domain-containing protein [Clostridium sp.]|nr:DUF3298 and DUF4163 domain-containing protein [Clostridium sp.]